MEADLIAKGIELESAKWPERAKKWFFDHGGRFNPETGVSVYGQKLQTAAERLAYAIQAKEIGAFKPNREKDELTYAIGTAEHSGQTRGLGRNTSWEHGFPNDRETYRSHQRRKEEEAICNIMLEQAVLQAEERAKALEETMHEKIKRQVQIAISAQRQASDLGMNVDISPPGKLKSSCASTELPNQDDVALRFPVMISRL